jgi:hypothetical protein
MIIDRADDYAISFIIVIISFSFSISRHCAFEADIAAIFTSMPARLLAGHDT